MGGVHGVSRAVVDVACQVARHDAVSLSPLAHARWQIGLTNELQSQLSFS